MSSSICLPAHILDAHITPRAREVLMLLASQTSAKAPTLWICQATVAERLRCSVTTVARAIKTLIEAKLIAETGLLHEGRVLPCAMERRREHQSGVEEDSSLR